MATDWSMRTLALRYFEKVPRGGHIDKEYAEEAVNALRRSQDHTAIQDKLNAAVKLIRKIANNPDCASASCGLDCKEFLAEKVPAKRLGSAK